MTQLISFLNLIAKLMTFRLSGPVHPSHRGGIEESLRGLTRCHLQELGQNQETSERQPRRHVLTSGLTCHYGR